MRHRHGHHIIPPQISLRRKKIVYGIVLGVWATGALWVLFHYFLMSEGPFGPAPHPLELWWLALHGAFAFASLWLLGMLWVIHIPIGWRTSRRRWSGGGMFAIAAWLVLTGYGLYYLGSEEVRPTMAVLHWAIGLAAPAVFLLHRFAREPKRNPLKSEHAFEAGMQHHRS